MAQPSQGGERIPCPRCRANNFLGQTHCWQCKSPLPPPEAVRGPAYPVAPTPQSYAYAPAPRSRSFPLLPFVGIVLLVFGGALYFVFQNRSKTTETTTRSRRLPDAAARVEQPGVIMDTGPAFDSSVSAENDPVAAEAKRAVDRARGELALPPPNAQRDENGRYRLRSGGAISQEEWERARRSIQDNRFQREPPLPAPF